MKFIRKMLHFVLSASTAPHRNWNCLSAVQTRRPTRFVLILKFQALSKQET